VGAHALHAFPGTWRPDHNIIDEEYKEGIYVGYRWADKHKTQPLFAFGHGMSYTQFKLSDVKADKAAVAPQDSISFTVNVTNTGKRAGAEVVQLYIHDVQASVDRPYKELKGFRKVYLQPGETKPVTLTIGKDALSFYDVKTADWKAEAGDFEALVGDASDHITSKTAFKLNNY